MRTYPTSTANPNVPKESYLIAETERASGEIIETYYATREGNTYKVTDWSGHKPAPAYMNELCKLTGDTPGIIEARRASYYRNAILPGIVGQEKDYRNE